MPPKMNNTRKRKRKTGIGDPDETTKESRTTDSTAPEPPGPIEDGTPGSVAPDENLTVDQDGSQTTARTKQDVLQQNAAPTDLERYERNAKANQAALDSIYAFYYEPDGSKKPDKRLISALYRLMSTETSDYFKEAISEEDFGRLEKIPNSVVRGQQVSAYERARKAYDQEMAAFQKEWDRYDTEWADYEVRFAEYEAQDAPDAQAPVAPVPPDKTQEPMEPDGPTNNLESLVDADYFHVRNLGFAVRTADRQERSRRLVINLKTQGASLKVAESLGALFRDDDVSPYLSEFKVFLSSTANDTMKVKYDKIVVYYVTAPADDDDEDGSDRIGDRLVDTIESSVTEDDIVDEFAPFYSWVGPGVAWAEEPKYYVEALTGSFTQTRSGIIAKVIKENNNIPDKETFVRLVAEAMRDARIDPDSPHRHLLDEDASSDEESTSDEEAEAELAA